MAKTEAQPICVGRQGCYGPDDIAVLTPYSGQLLLLRQALQEHVVVHLEEADEKLLKDAVQAKSAKPRAAPADSGAGGRPSSTQQETPCSSHAQLLKPNAIKKTSLNSMLRLATVDNFQGGCNIWLVGNSSTGSKGLASPATL